MSYHTLSAKPLNKSMSVLLKRASHVGLGLGAFTPVLALANPTGAAVMTGQASITSPSANGLVIHQSSQSAIINWQQFNIGSGQYVQFLQPSTSSVVLNRVVGGSPTSIFGNLTANGQVFIVNTNGVFFGHGASIDAQGFLASSLDISDSNFLSKHYVFNEAGAGNGKVVNQGNITAHRGGYVVLAGDYSENDGIISAQSGHVILASGAKSTLTLQGNSLVSYVVNGATLSSLAGVDNAGTLSADGGTVIMTADVANALKATVVNNTGLVEARSLSKYNGGIFLTAQGGNIVNAGTLDADAMNAGHAGGNIVLKGDGLTNLTNTSKISALGIGADGGHVELSGNVLNVRGVANIGKRGSLLLDPGTMSIDVMNPPSGSLNQNSAGTGGTGIGHMSIGFIQTELNAAVDVNISAANRIQHGGSVTAITATTGLGKLNFKVGNNGHVDMAGVDITIKGKLTAEMGYGSFGHLRASSVDLNASHSLALGRAVASNHGLITKQSVLATKGTVTLTVGSNGIRSAEGGSGNDGIAIKAKFGANVNGNINNGSGNLTLVGQTVDDNGNITTTGNVNIVASAGYADVGNINDNGIGNINIAATGSDVRVGNINAYGGNVTITDTSGDVFVHGIDATNGNASINDAGHTVSFQSNGYASAGGNLAVTAKTIVSNENLRLAAGAGSTDNLTIKSIISLGGLDANLDLQAGGTIKLSNKVTATGGITIDAGHLAYIGKAGELTISAGGNAGNGGDLTLDASIGSAAHPGNYNVTLNDKGYGIFLERSIHLGASDSLTATETGRHGLATSHEAIGVLVGDSEGTPVTLSAGGAIALKGWNVGVGSVLNNNHSSNYGPVTIAAGKNVSMTGNGNLGSNGGNVSVVAGNASHSGTVHDNSILITAGGNISMKASRVSLRGGVADASKDSGSSTDNATVTLKATGKVTLTGGSANSSNNAVDVQGGTAVAEAGNNGSANANAGVSISGNKGVTLTATHVNINGGSAGVLASVEGGNVTAKAAANAGVQLASKSGNISLTGNSAEGGTVQLRGGNAGFGGHAHASGEAATATAAAHADVSLNAGGAINLSAFRVQVSGGYGAGAQSNSAGTIAATQNVADARGDNVTATFTATNGVSLIAGTGGIGITGVDNVSIHGGDAELNHASVTGQDSGHASASGNGAVTFLTTGNLNVTASSGSLRIHGGSSVAGRSKANGASYGAAVLKGNGEVNITAAAVTLNAKNGSVRIEGGGSGEGSEGAAQLAGASAEQGGKASISGLADVAITAKTGGIAISAKQELIVRGGQAAAAGQERFNVNSSSGTNHFGSSSLSSTRNVHHHNPLTSYASVTADNSGATANLTGKAGVALTAKGALTLTQTGSSGGSKISIAAGNSAGAVAHLDAIGGATATLTGDAGIAVKAASLKVTGKNVNVFGGQGAARGGSTGYGSNYVLHRNSVGGTSHTSVSDFSTAAKVNHAGGAGSKIALNGKSAVTLQAGTINLTAFNGHLEVSGGYGAAIKQRLSATSGGSAAVNTVEGITITAKTAFTAAAKGSHGSLRIEGGGGIAGSHASVQALGSSNEAASKAQLNGNGQVTITSPVVTLTAASALSLEGGFDNASNGANVIAAYGGSAGITANSALNITVAGKFTASLSGSGNEGGITVEGGGDGGEGAHVFAHGSHAKAAINNKSDVNITATAAGAVISMSTGNRKGARLFVSGGGFTGHDAAVSASDSASAAANLSANVNLTAAAGNVTLSAKKGNLLLGQNQDSFANGAGVTVDAGYGAATFTASDNVNISAINVKLNAGTFVTTDSTGTHVHAGSIDVQTNASGNAEGATVTGASYGAAAYTVNDQVNLKATGTLSLTAGGNLDVGSASNGSPHHHLASGAKAQASGTSATAALNLNESVLFQGNAAVNITAGEDAALTTVSGPSGSGGGGRAGAVAGAKGTATFTDVGQINIVTKGAFSLKAGSDASLFAGSGNRNAYASASGAGASATRTDDESFNLTANTVTISAGNSIDVLGGEGVAWDATATANHGGVATLTANRSMNVTAKSAITLSLTGSGNEGEINIGNGSSAAVGRGAGAFANSHGGKATVTGNGTTNLTVTAAGGSITLSAGNHTEAEINVRSGTVGEFDFSGSTPRFAGASAGVGGSASVNFLANTNFTAKGAIAFDAGASGSLFIAPTGLDMADGHVDANGGKATANAQSVVNIAGGSVSFTAGDDITVTAASLVGRGTGPSPSFLTQVAARNGGTATMTVQTGVKITATGAFTATAGSDLDFVANGNNSDAMTAASATVLASHGGAQATLTATNTIQVNAATIALKATTGSLVIAGGSGGAVRDHVIAQARNDKAAVNVDDGVNLTATGNFSAKAGGSMFIAAGASAADSASVDANNRGVAKLSANSNVNITVGGKLTLAAADDLNVFGGDRAGPSINAQSGGSASAAVKAGVNLTSGKSASLTAGGNLTLRGGGSAFLLGDEFFAASSSPAAKGKVTGNLNTGVNLTTPSNATLTAGGNLIIAAGDGATVAVGAFRTASGGLDGHSWAGGSANLNANVGATVTAGKNVTLTAGTAGTGSLLVLGLGTNPHESTGIQNIVSTRGGSSRAIANVTMTGNALVTAGLNITVNAADNASIVGGVINDVRVDHALGDVSLTGSANAVLHAGQDVVLNNIGGSLTLVAANAGPSEEGMLVDAHGNSGTAVAVGHADAGISAGRDIVTVHALGGGLNLIGGDLVDAVALGSASSQHANGTANANLKAGRNITISGAGDLNLLAGQFGAATASGGSHFVGSGSRTAALQIHAGVAAGSAVTLKFTGNGFLAGGDSVAASVNYLSHGASFDTGIATADAGVSITGKSVSVSIGGNLLARGGSGAKATTVILGGGNVGSASVDAGIKVSATGGNVAFTVGGDASFLGGSGVGGKAINISGFQNGTGSSPSPNFGANVENATAKGDVNITATGNIGVTLTGAGNLTVAGAPDAEPFGTVAGGLSAGRLFGPSAGTPTAPDGVTNVTASGTVQFKAGGTITVTQHGGNLTILGGSNAASFASAQAIGSGAKTTLTANTNVLFQAGGALKFTGANSVTLLGGTPAFGASGSAFPGNYLNASGSGATVTEKIDASVKLTGATVSIGHTNPIVSTAGSVFAFSSGGANFSFDNTVSVTSTAVHAIRFSPVHNGIVIHDGLLRVAPVTTGLSFGGTQPLTAAPVTASGGATQSVVGATPDSVNVQTQPVALSTLQSASLVPSLVTLFGTDTDAGLGAAPSTGATLFTPAVDAGGYSKAFSGACTALVVQGSDARCSTGGK